MGKRLTVAGSGIMPDRDITLGTLRLLSESQKILFFRFPGWQKIFQEWGAVQAEDLTPLYRDGEIDVQNYQSILTKIIAELSVHDDIMLILPGHPRFGVTISQWLPKILSDTECEINVLPGVSSFDTMLNDLALDPLERGITIADANRILLFRNTLDPSIGLFIYHVCSVGTVRTHVSNPEEENALHLLQKYLIDAFGGGHEVILLTSAVTGGGGRLLKIPLVHLQKALSNITFESTLFVPAKRPTSIDRNYLRTLGWDDRTVRGQC